MLFLTLQQPGSSSMIGLFQEHGPCRITNDSSSVTLNPFSWNNEANVLYIDQPVGVGFSHGDLKVGTSQQAASDIWTFMQIFLSDSQFSKYQPNNLAIWTESLVKRPLLRFTWLTTFNVSDTVDTMVLHLLRKAIRHDCAM